MRGNQNITSYPNNDINLADVIDVIGTGEDVASNNSYENNKGTKVISPYREPPKMNLSSRPQYSLSVKPPDPNKQKKSAFVKIVEQPASKGLRFRYECEGRSAGSIPGATSTPDNRTFPTIQVEGYVGRAVVVISCVTSEPPYRPHPHQLVGKEGCKKGVCTMEMSPTMSCSFPNLGIQCVKKKDIEDALALRQQIRVDPFQTGFAHKNSTQSIDLNCVRLCFQVFLEGNEQGAFTFALKPVVSQPIYDKKAKCDLTICRLTESSAPAVGGREILLFCDKINKDDIQVRFYQEENGQIVWEGLADFQPSDVHKQYGICCRTPRYKNIEIELPVKVEMQLRRPSDGAVSESRPFEFLPLDMGRSYWSAKRLKTNYTVFNQILASDQNSRNMNQPGPTLKHKLPLARAPITNISGMFPQQMQQPSAAPQQAQANITHDIQSNNEDDEDSGLVVSEKIMPQPSLRPVTMPGSIKVQSIEPKQEIIPPPRAKMFSHHTNEIKNEPTMPDPTMKNMSPTQQITNLKPITPTSNMRPNEQFPPHIPQYAKKSEPDVIALDHITSMHNRDNRPVSEFSIQSDVSNFTVNTHQSVNDILSMAEDISVYSLDTNRYSVAEDSQSNRYSMDIDNIGVSEAGLDIKQESNDMLNLQLQQCLKNPVMDYMGSMTSVTTVKENKNKSHGGGQKEEDNSFNETPTDINETEAFLNMNSSDLDLGQIYDDVMQCVYDDVDTKYDDISTLIQGEAPVPPMRKYGLSVEEEIDKPLPVLPKNPSLLHKLSEKKEELLKEREKEKEKKRLYDEQKQKEKEIQDERKRKEKEEKENKLKEEREKRRIEEEQKKEMRKKEEEEKKLKKKLEIEKENKLKQSLFHRLFQRSQSKGDGGPECMETIEGHIEPMDLPPPVPPHGAMAPSQKDIDFESEIASLQQIIEQGNIENLDTMVSDFAKQCLPEALPEQQTNISPSSISQL